MMYDVAL